MPPIGAISGNRESDLNGFVWLWNRQTKLGKVFSYSTIFTLPKGGKRSPDVPWIANERWDALPREEQEKFATICPDFVIELRSRTDSLTKLQEKMQEYLDSGLTNHLIWGGRFTRIYFRITHFLTTGNTEMIATATISPQLTIPHLENGDKLTRREFERRYKAMPNLKKAELIEGIVYIMASPLRITNHGEPHADIIGWLSVYKAFTPNLQLGDNCTVRLDADNEPQPDALLRIRNGGQSTISEDGYVEGAPELIVEIAASTVSLDLHQKLNVYRRNQVQEYLVWRVEDGEFDWFRLTNEEYIKLETNSEGIICSQIFPGLWLDKDALLAGDLAKVLEVLQLGIVRR